MPFNVQAEAIAFDLDDTICDYKGAKEAALTHVANTVSTQLRTRQGFLASYRIHEPRLFKTVLSRAISIEEYQTRRFQMPLESNRLPASPEKIKELNSTYMRRCNEEIQLFPEVIVVLRGLRNFGVPLALIINGHSDGQRTKINALGLWRYFDSIIISSEVRAAKPDARIYQIAAEALNVEPRELLMVGDSLHDDYRGALHAGCQALLLNREASESTAEIITDLKEIKNRLAMNQDIERSSDHSHTSGREKTLS